MKFALNTLNKVGDSQRLTMTKKSKVNYPLVHHEMMLAHHLLFLSSWRQLDIRLIDYPQEEAEEVANAMKGTSLYLAKRGSDGITSPFVAMRTNLLFLYSLTPADGGMESTGSESVFPFILNPKPTVLCKERGRKVVQE